MKESNKNEEPQIKVNNEASVRRNWNTGTGIGPNDCMSLEVFNQLNALRAISGKIYVCGLGI